MSKTQEQLKAAIQAAAQGGEQRASNSRTENSSSPRPGAPRHPIRSFQGPFEESIEDATNPPDTQAQDLFNQLDPKKRRQRLLDTVDSTNGTYNEQWRARSAASQFHPLTKIISQIAFGVHLLHQQLAKSDEEVVKILQKHVDDVDNFVQRAEEDLDLAISDIRERISYLKLPLEHTGVFDVMLDDKAFRTQIIEGNEKIEKVVEATAGLVKDLQVDVHKGMDSTIDFGKYLDDIADDWPQNDRGSIEIFRTMQANVEGWIQCMSTLQMKGNGLSVAVVQLGSILSEMAKRAASASRREQRRAERAANAGHSKSRNTSYSKVQGSRSHERRRSQKPLPRDPDLVARVVEATLPDAKLPKRRPSRAKTYGEARRISNPPQSVAGSIKSAKSAKSAKSTKSTKGERERKPPPVRIDKLPGIKKSDKWTKMTEFANVFRFHGSAPPSSAPSPLPSPTHAPPSFPKSDAVSPIDTPRASTMPPSPKALLPSAPVEMDAEASAVYEMDSTPQATLAEARSRLRERQSQELLSSKALTAHPPDADDAAHKVAEDSSQKGSESSSRKGAENSSRKGSISTPPSITEATDSAYASSPELEPPPRPTTAPNTNRPPAIGALGIFPSTSMTSLPSILAVEQDRQSDKMSVASLSVTALPVLTSPQSSSPISPSAKANVKSTTPKEPSRLRHGTAPVAHVIPSLKKRTSLTALKNYFFRKGSTDSIPTLGKMSQLSPTSEKEKENKLPVVKEAKPAGEKVLELPG